MLSFSNEQVDALVLISAQNVVSSTWTAVASVSVAAIISGRTDKAFVARMEKAFAKAKVSDDYASRLIRAGKHEKALEVAKAAIKRNGTLEDNVAAVSAKLKTKFVSLAKMRETLAGDRAKPETVPTVSKADLEAEVASLKGKLSAIEAKPANAPKVPGKAATPATCAKALTAWVEAGQAGDILGQMDSKALNALAQALQAAMAAQAAPVGKAA